MKQSVSVAVVLSASLLAACGGGGGTATSSSSGAPSTAATTSDFPSGVSGASPTAMTTSGGTVIAMLPWHRRALDWGGTVWTAMREGDWRTARWAMMKALPMGTAHAAPAVIPEGLAMSGYISRVAAGTETPTAVNLDLRSFFANYTGANCYGPRVYYRDHDDGSLNATYSVTGEVLSVSMGAGVPTHGLQSPRDKVKLDFLTGGASSSDGTFTVSALPSQAQLTAPLTIANTSGNANVLSGMLPGGDTGLWTAREGNQTTGKPCSAAQLNNLMDPVKKRINATMIFGARMRALARAGSGMPAAGASVDLTTSVNTFFQSLVPNGVTGSVTSAGISNAAGVYTYTVVAQGTSTVGAITLTKKIVLKVVHDGTSETFSGTATYATYDSHQSGTPPQANSCTPKGGAANSGTRIEAGTLRYVKASSTEMRLSAREALYCLNGSDSAMTSTFSDYLSLTSNGELDPTKDENTTNNSKGWIQAGTGFKRLAADYNPETGAGNYKFAWQAGVNDRYSRMFAMNIAYNSTTEARTGHAFFGFSGAMNPPTTDTAPTALKGMICNWAGPGSTQVVSDAFQYQRIVLSATATDWDIDSATGSNKISYAPTNSCASTNTVFSATAADIWGTSPTGAGTTSDLRAKESAASVQAAIEAVGFVNPSLY